MTIYKLLDSCWDAGLLKLTIYDTYSGDDVWSGDGDEVPEEYGYCEIESWDIPTKSGELTVNITLDDEEGLEDEEENEE